MNFIVPKDTLTKTECDRNFSCIYEDTHIMCEINENIDEILFMAGKGVKTIDIKPN